MTLRYGSAPEVFAYGQRIDGAQNLGVDFGGVRLLVQPSTAHDNEAARQLAGRIADSETERQLLEGKLETSRFEANHLREQVRKLEAKLAERRAINEAAIAGRRRFFGRVLVRPVNRDWSGEVWLLDPEKKERGMGLRFASLAEVRALHPELWIVDVTDDGVLLDAWGEPPAPREHQRRAA